MHSYNKYTGQYEWFDPNTNTFIPIGGTSGQPRSVFEIETAERFEPAYSIPDTDITLVANYAGAVGEYDPVRNGELLQYLKAEIVRRWPVVPTTRTGIQEVARFIQRWHARSKRYEALLREQLELGERLLADGTLFEGDNHERYRAYYSRLSAIAQEEV